VSQQAGSAVPLRALCGDYALVVEKAARRQRLEVLQTVRGQRAVYRVARIENPALRVAE
jgi:hypothetical protein